MCTGDNLNTATAISINAKILTTEERDNNPDSCMTGAQFQEAVDGLT
jgi:magnesium-transporting ATPase (P-type)